MYPRLLQNSKALKEGFHRFSAVNLRLAFVEDAFALNP